MCEHRPCFALTFPLSMNFTRNCLLLCVWGSYPTWPKVSVTSMVWSRPSFSAAWGPPTSCWIWSTELRWASWSVPSRSLSILLMYGETEHVQLSGQGDTIEGCHCASVLLSWRAALPVSSSPLPSCRYRITGWPAGGSSKCGLLCRTATTEVAGICFVFPLKSCRAATSHKRAMCTGELLQNSETTSYRCHSTLLVTFG